MGFLWPCMGTRAAHFFLPFVMGFLSVYAFSGSYRMDFPGGSDGKVSGYNVGDLGSIPGSGRSPDPEYWSGLPVFLPGESHGRRSLVGYSPWGCKESDMTEWLHLHLVLTTYRLTSGNLSSFARRWHYSIRLRFLVHRLWSDFSENTLATAVSSTHGVSTAE